LREREREKKRQRKREREREREIDRRYTAKSEERRRGTFFKSVLIISDT